LVEKRLKRKAKRTTRRLQNEEDRIRRGRRGENLNLEGKENEIKKGRPVPLPNS